MTEQPNVSFTKLFKKYRLKSQFITLKELGDTLNASGLFFEDSTLSKWQTGDRIPNDRKILLILIKIFAENGGITNINEGDKFFESAGFGYLTQKEKDELPSFLFTADQKFSLCQAPNFTQHFIGRHGELHRINQILQKDKSPIIAIYGPAGVGKSVLAVEAGRLFGNLFPDGILWSKLNTTDPMNILAKIAFTFGKNVTSVKDLESRSEIVRSILSDKKALLIFDDVESSSQLRHLLPAKTKSCIIATSRNSAMEILADAYPIHLNCFTLTETFQFFQTKLGTTWFDKNKMDIERIGKVLGFLPLALNIILTKIRQGKDKSVSELAKILEREKSRLELLACEEVSIRSSFEISFSSLNEKLKRLFESLAVFSGEDFSLEAASAINKLDPITCHEQLSQLCGKSLLDYSQSGRFFLHPLLKVFAKEKIMKREPFLLAAKYYTNFLENKVRQKQFANYELLNQELDNMMAICNWTFENKEQVLFLGLWKNISRFIAEVGLWDELERLGLLVYQCSDLPKYQNLKADCCINVLSWINFWKGNLKKAKGWAREGYEIAQKTKNLHLKSLAQNRLAFIFDREGNFSEAGELINLSLIGLKQVNDLSQIAETLRYLTYIPYIKPSHSQKI